MDSIDGSSKQNMNNSNSNNNNSAQYNRIIEKYKHIKSQASFTQIVQVNNAPKNNYQNRSITRRKTLFSKNANCPGDLQNKNDEADSFKKSGLHPAWKSVKVPQDEHCIPQNGYGGDLNQMKSSYSFISNSSFDQTPSFSSLGGDCLGVQSHSRYQQQNNNPSNQICQGVQGGSGQNENWSNFCNNENPSSTSQGVLSSRHDLNLYNQSNNKRQQAKILSSNFDQQSMLAELSSTKKPSLGGAQRKPR